MSPPYPLYPYFRRDEHDSLNSTTPTNTTVPAAKETDQPKHSGGGFPSFLIAIIVIAVLAGIGFAAFVFFRRRAAHSRAFGSAPGPSIDGAKKGLSALWYKIKNPRARSSSAGFEGISAGPRGAARGRALDPDEAWDTRVGQEADGYYDETELTSGYRGNSAYSGATEYSGASGRMPAENPFGDEHAASGQKQGENPFGDEHGVAPTLRSVSPRPEFETPAPGLVAGGGPPSPTRRSLFKENV